jgi:hypothetical protein
MDNESDTRLSAGAAHSHSQYYFKVTVTDVSCEYPAALVQRIVKIVLVAIVWLSATPFTPCFINVASPLLRSAHASLVLRMPPVTHAIFAVAPLTTELGTATRIKNGRTVCSSQLACFVSPPFLQVSPKCIELSVVVAVEVAVMSEMVPEAAPLVLNPSPTLAVPLVFALRHVHESEIGLPIS